MITNPIEKSKGRGLGVYRSPFVLRPEKILETRFIDSYLHFIGSGKLPSQYIKV
jgi:hypothetical protein